MSKIYDVILNTTNFRIIDNLVYTYTENKLDKVDDSSGSNEGFKDGANITTEYRYDPNGNMKNDANKGIPDISHNYLNLPTQVTLAGGVINYVYKATGAKQRKIVGTITTDYANGFQYENNILQFFPQLEGYINNNSGTFEYIYQYKDHLGNVRLSYDKNLSIVEENNYYPFGLNQKGYNDNVSSLGNAAAKRYKFNGKELQDENIGGNQLNLYDYGARNYDLAIGRFTTMDPSSENYKALSPFNYVNNNSINSIDPDGRDIIVLSAPAHVHDLGHAAVLIGNPKTGYRYYSKNGTNANKGIYGPSNKNPVKGKYFRTLQAFESSKDNADKDGSYTRVFEIKTDEATDEKMEEAAKEAVESEYNVLY